MGGARRDMKRKPLQKLILCLLVLALGASLGACTSRPRPARSEGENLFRLGFRSMPDTLNPYAASGAEAECLFSLLYDTLFTADAVNGEYVGALCEEWSCAPTADGEWRWDLTLRRGVKWHDGEKLTARDVEFSLQSIKDFSALYSSPDCDFIDAGGIYVQDDTHIAFVTWCDAESTKEFLSRIPILPEHIWNKLPYMQYDNHATPADYTAARTELIHVAADASVMIGSGLYRWDGFNGKKCTLRLNEDYWGSPSAAGVVELHFGVKDPVGELRRGALDALYELTASELAELGSEGAYLTSGTSDTLYALSFNQHASAPSTGNVLLRQKTVRRAIDLCTDRTGLMETVFGGGLARTDLLLPGSRWAPDGAEDRFDPQAAAKLLSGDGYEDRDGDGVRESVNGEVLRFSFLCSDSSPAWKEAAEKLRADLMEAGIALDVTALPAAELYARMDSWNYDIVLTAWQSRNEPYQPYGMFFWDNGQNTYARPGTGQTKYLGWNDSGYMSIPYDKLYRTLKAEETELGETVKALRDILTEDCPAVPIGLRAVYQVCGVAWEDLLNVYGNGVFFTPATLRQQMQTIQGAK